MEHFGFGSVGVVATSAPSTVGPLAGEIGDPGEADPYEADPGEVPDRDGNRALVAGAGSSRPAGENGGVR